MVLLLSHRYGSVEPTTGKSYTELEYEAARETARDVLAFEITAFSGVEPLSLDPDDLRKLQQFSVTMTPQLRRKVKSAEELEGAVQQALHEWRHQVETGAS